MRFFEIVLSGAALVSAALAVEFNSWPESVKAGESVTLTYSPKDAATTIILRKGASTDLDTLETLTTSSTGGSFTWAVPSNLENGDDYAFEIRQAGAEPNYSGQFSLSGGLASAVSSAYSTVKETSSASKTAPASTSAYSTMSTVATTAASASGSIVPTHGSNSTISTGTPTASKSASSSASASAAVPPVENSGAASSLGVNAAAIFGAMGALAYFA